jgi:hypothetical protein
LADCDFNRAALHPAYPIKRGTSAQRTQASPERRHPEEPLALDPLENSIRRFETLMEKRRPPGELRSKNSWITASQIPRKPVTGVATSTRRQVTWCVVEEVESGDWAIAGNPLTTADVHALARGKAAQCVVINDVTSGRLFAVRALSARAAVTQMKRSRSESGIRIPRKSRVVFQLS